VAIAGARDRRVGALVVFYASLPPLKRSTARSRSFVPNCSPAKQTGGFLGKCDEGNT